MADHIILEDRDGFSIGDLNNFAINHSIRPEAACLRLLCGTCKVTNIEIDRTTEVKTNFLKSPTWQNSDINLNFLDNYQEGLTSQDYNNHLAAGSDYNRGFYRDLLDEMIVATCAAEDQQGIISFLHTYRAYERIAYAFPMIYAYKSRDYLGSFQTLKGWIGDPKTDGSAGELAFFKKYLETVYDENQLNATTDLYFEGSDETRTRQFSLLRNKVLKWDSGYTTEATIDNEILSVPFKDMHTLLLTVRNRYFHQMSGRTDNIKQRAIIDPETFFKVLARPMLSYVATLFHDILILDMDQTT